jgi:hypothetical protein
MGMRHSACECAALLHLVLQIGLQEHAITPALGAAITVAALATLGVCALGTDLLARRTEPIPSPPSLSPPQSHPKATPDAFAAAFQPKACKDISGSIHAGAHFPRGGDG